ARAGLDSMEDDGFFRRDAEHAKTAIEFGHDASVDRPPAMGPASAGPAGTAKNSAPVPAGAGSSEASKEVELLQDRPGKQKAADAPAPARGPANLVFAIDVSQSMAGPNRLPLVQEGVRRLADRLRPDDLVSVITYAAKATAVLSALPAARSGELRKCLAGLEAAGLTNGWAGLELAYTTARSHWIEGGLNVVVLCTDGNFNLGITEE